MQKEELLTFLDKYSFNIFRNFKTKEKFNIEKSMKVRSTYKKIRYCIEKKIFPYIDEFIENVINCLDSLNFENNSLYINFNKEFHNVVISKARAFGNITNDFKEAANYIHKLINNLKILLSDFLPRNFYYFTSFGYNYAKILSTLKYKFKTIDFLNVVTNKNISKEFIHFILSQNIEIENIDDCNFYKGSKAFFVAICHNDKNLLEFLLKNNADPDRIYDRKTILSHAIEKNNVEFIKTLLKNGINVNLCSYKDSFFLACGDRKHTLGNSYDNAEIVSLLLRYNPQLLNLKYWGL